MLTVSDISGYQNLLSTIGAERKVSSQIEAQSKTARDGVAASASSKSAELAGGEADKNSPSARATDQKIQAEIRRMMDTEQKVIAHEQAHKSVGGQYAGAASYEYTQGPDGKKYITGGEVSIDVSEESKPKDTIAKMQQVRAAALAPADPSPQDMSVANAATEKETSAQMKLAQEIARQAAASKETTEAPATETGGDTAKTAKTAETDTATVTKPDTQKTVVPSAMNQGPVTPSINPLMAAMNQVPKGSFVSVFA